MIWLCFLAVTLPIVSSRELMIQRACHINPELSFCKSHTSTSAIRSESEKKRDIFLRWAFVAAKDAQDIEDVDTEELETSRKKTYSVLDYCTKYKENFQTYCKNGNLEKLEGLLSQFCTSYVKNCDVNPNNIKLQESIPTPPPLSSKVFPTPQPFVSSSSSPPKEEEDDKSGTGYCEENSQKYKMECEKEGFTPDAFCENFKRRCPKLEKVDDETTQKVDDSLETPEEFEEHEAEKKVEGKVEEKAEEKEEEEKAEGQGAGTDEVTAYCTNYIENYNFYCVGDMLPEHEKFCESYKKNCPDRVP